MSQHEPLEKDESERFEEPIKIRWTGRARERIHHCNMDFTDDGWEDHFFRPSIYSEVSGRLKTRLAILTVREAECIRYELRNYMDASSAWVNSSIVDALGRVAQELDEAMAERGYEADFSERDQWGRTFLGYEPVEGGNGGDQS